MKKLFITIALYTTIVGCGDASGQLSIGKSGWGYPAKDGKSSITFWSDSTTTIEGDTMMVIKELLDRERLAWKEYEKVAELWHLCSQVLENMDGVFDTKKSKALQLYTKKY